MYCMKCGKKVPEKQAFCDTCLAVMGTYPVKKETHVLLPNRDVPVVSKKPPVKKRVLPIEARLARATKVIQWLSLTLVAAVLALLISVSLLIETITPESHPGSIGQNYSTTDAEKNRD